jgi:hypothetical protein
LVTENCFSHEVKELRAFELRSIEVARFLEKYCLRHPFVIVQVIQYFYVNDTSNCIVLYHKCGYIFQPIIWSVERVRYSPKNMAASRKGDVTKKWVL